MSASFKFDETRELQTELEFRKAVYQTEKVLLKIFSLKSLAFDTQKVFM